MCLNSLLQERKSRLWLRTSCLWMVCFKVPSRCRVRCLCSWSRFFWTFLLKTWRPGTIVEVSSSWRLWPIPLKSRLGIKVMGKIVQENWLYKPKYSTAKSAGRVNHIDHSDMPGTLLRASNSQRWTSSIRSAEATGLQTTTEEAPSILCCGWAWTRWSARCWQPMRPCFWKASN